MTKVQAVYALSRPLGEHDLDNFRRLTTIYGILMAKLSPKLDEVRIEYDASRLTQDDLQAALATHGIPIRAEPVREPVIGSQGSVPA
jgi:hypothetical protein